MNPYLLTTLPLLLAGCQIDGPADLGESEDTSLMRFKGDFGSASGQFDYCDGATLCAQGEGDCDLDAQCEAGLVCVDNLADNFGMAWTTDVCAPSHCEDGSLSGDETAIDFGGSCGSTCGGTAGQLNYCRPGCECAAGFGDCSTDADCQAGLVCGDNNGGQFGLHWTYDVCVEPTCDNGVLDGGETVTDFGGVCGSQCSGANGDQEGFCTEGCPCSNGEGDCDSDLECDPGLRCILNQGATFGLDPLHDICMAPTPVSSLVAGNLVITEIMINPLVGADASAEYFEIYNNTSNVIDLNGLYVKDNTAVQNFTVGTSILLESHDYAIFARSANTATNGGITPDFDYVNTFGFSDTSDALILLTASGGTEIDRVVYTTTWLRPNGRSLELSRNRITSDNNISSNWCESLTLLTNGDYGTPGVQNRACP